MTTLKTLTIVAALLASGTSLTMAQNGPATGGQSHPSTATDTCMPTIRITATIGIGITKQIAAEADCLTTNQ